MATPVISVDADTPDPAVIAQAADLLLAGGLVAFPTETVYGLGANGLDPAAIARIYQAKGRPPTNPVILHVARAADVPPLVAELPPLAGRLMAAFWPGALTLVLPRSDRVPPEATAGGPTVAVRCPAHPVAAALIRAAGVPIAAPSANRSTELSPTIAQHVLRSLDGRIDLILDAGPTRGGLESTVLDLTVDPPRILRPGLIAPADLAVVVGPVMLPTGPCVAAEDSPQPSPGLLARHYAPRTPTEIVEGDSRDRLAVLAASGLRIGWVYFGADRPAGPSIEALALPDDPVRVAAILYAELHRLDRAELDRLLIELPPAEERWLAVRDRLARMP